MLERRLWLLLLCLLLLLLLLGDLHMLGEELRELLMLALIHLDWATSSEVRTRSANAALNGKKLVGMGGGSASRGRAYVAASVVLRPNSRAVIDSGIVMTSVAVVDQQWPTVHGK
jgi:hypothetical protein